jgi:hypothetical protein
MYLILLVGGLLGRVRLDVEQHLREFLVHAVQLAHALAALGQQLQQLAGGQLAVAGGGVVQQDHMAALLAADGIAVLPHVLEHVAVAHGGALGADALAP